MPTITENNGAVEAEEDDMEHLENEDRKSWGEETASGSGEGEEDHEEDDEDEGGSSEMDEEECDKRKTECMDDLTELNHQFCKLKDQLFNEREAQIEKKMDELYHERDPDYLARITELERCKLVRLQVAKIQDNLRREAIQEKFLSEELAARQHMESERELLHDQLKAELEEKIKHLEEDRHNIDITSDLYQSQNQRKRKRHDPYNSDRRKKPVQVTGPYIVYALRDSEVMEDLIAIKRYDARLKTMRSIGSGSNENSNEDGSERTNGEMNKQTNEEIVEDCSMDEEGLCTDDFLGLDKENVEHCGMDEEGFCTDDFISSDEEDFYTELGEYDWSLDKEHCSTPKEVSSLPEECCSIEKERCSMEEEARSMEEEAWKEKVRSPEKEASIVQEEASIAEEED